MPMLKVRHISSGLTPLDSISRKIVGTRQALLCDLGAELVGKAAGHVLDQATAGDVGGPKKVDGPRARRSWAR